MIHTSRQLKALVRKTGIVQKRRQLSGIILWKGYLSAFLCQSTGSGSF